jgi:hypothetical protein
LRGPNIVFAHRYLGPVHPYKAIVSESLESHDNRTSFLNRERCRKKDRDDLSPFPLPLLKRDALVFWTQGPGDSPNSIRG